MSGDYILAPNSIELARRAIVQSIDIYNNIRLHTNLGMITPSLKPAA